MINFRYHVISLIAVFLALGVGIILGANTLNQTLVHQLERDARDFKNRNAQLRSQSDALNAQLSFYEKFGAQIVSGLVRAKLAGRSATLLIQNGADASTISSVEQVLQQAGTPKPSRITMTDRWMLADDSSKTALSQALSAAPGTDNATLVGMAGPAVGARLATNTDPRSAGDLIKSLADAGLIRLAGIPQGPFPAAGQIIVVVPSPDPAAVPDQANFFVPLIRTMASRRLVAVAESTLSKSSLADRVRSDSALAPRVATVDDADTAPGGLSLVWSLRTLMEGHPALHYGLHSGTDGIAPSVAP